MVNASVAGEPDAAVPDGVVGGSSRTMPGLSCHGWEVVCVLFCPCTLNFRDVSSLKSQE